MVAGRNVQTDTEPMRKLIVASRVTRPTKKLVEAAAEEAGKSVSAWAADALHERAVEQLGRVGSGVRAKGEKRQEAAAR